MAFSFGDSDNIEASNLRKIVKSGDDEKGVYLVGSYIDGGNGSVKNTVGGFSTSLSEVDDSGVTFYNIQNSNVNLALLATIDDASPVSGEVGIEFGSNTDTNLGIIKAAMYDLTTFGQNTTLTSHEFSVIGAGVSGSKWLDRKTELSEDNLNSSLFTQDAQQDVIMSAGIYDGPGVFGNSKTFINISNIDVDNSSTSGNTLTFDFINNFDTSGSDPVVAAGCQIQSEDASVPIYALIDSDTYSESSIDVNFSRLGSGFFAEPPFIPDQCLVFIIAFGKSPSSTFSDGNDMSQLGRLISIGDMETTGVGLSACYVKASGSPSLINVCNCDAFSGASVRNGTGDYTISFNTSYSADNFDNIIPIAYTMASSTATLYSTAISIGTGAVNVKVYDEDGNAADQDFSLIVLGT